jgi:surface protein
MPINANGKLRVKGVGQIGPILTEFISVWDTTLGNEPTITLPLVFSGNYNFSVNWGDGNTDTITAYDQAERIHNYATGGVKIITITGTIEGWSFGSGGGSNDKLTSITNIGQLKLGNEGAYFQECSNLTTIGGTFDLTGTTNMGVMFNGCTSLTSVNGIEAWDTSAVTNMYSMFQGATSFNGNISSWDVSSVTEMGGMFINATTFNQPLNSWDVSSVTGMNSMFYNATAFNQPLNSWNVSSVTDMGSFMDGKSTADYDYYDDLLNAWSLLTLQNGVEWGMGSIEYTSAGAKARQDIINNYSWTITDGGEYSPTYTFKTTQIGGTNIAQIYTTTGYIKFNSTVYLVNDEITYTLDNPNGEYTLVSCDEFGTPSGDITTLTFANSNQITEFNGTGLSGLTTLSLGLNQLTSFDGTELINLTGLNLTDNGLSSLSGFTLPPNLLSLELNDNELISFDVSGLPNLVSLVLTLNPLEASDNDLILSQFDINGVTIDSAGVIPGFFTSGGRTSASDTAYNNLISKGWYIEGADLI